MQRLITLPSFTLHFASNLLVPSFSPHIKVILPPNSTSQEVTLFSSTMETEVTKNKNKSFFFIIIFMLSSNIYLYFNTSIHHCLQLLYPNLTWLPSSFGVKLDNGVGDHAPRSPPRLTVFNRHPLFHNPVTSV